MSISKIAGQILTTAWLIGIIGVSLADTQAPEEPPEPKATSAVQKVLDEATTHAQAKRVADALSAAERARVVAQKETDGAGEAQAQRQRAQTLQALNRSEEAVAAWRAAAAVWGRVGDGPGQVEALGTAGLLLSNQQPGEAQALFDQALALGQAETKRPLASAKIIQSIGGYCAQRRLFEPARAWLQASLSAFERLAPGSLDLAENLNNLGSVIASQGDLLKAFKYHQRALAIQEQKAPGSLGVARVLHNLGIISDRQGRPVIAENYYQQALTIRKKHDPNSLETAATLNNLGVVARRQGKLQTALAYYQQALAIHQQHDADSLEVATSLNNLGVIEGLQSRLEAAKDYNQRALVIQEKRAPGSLAVASSLQNLGAGAQEQGDLATARAYYQRALAIREKQAPDSIDVVKSLNSLGIVARRQGDLEAARAYYQQALAIGEKRAPDSPEVGDSLHSLGTVAFQQGDLVAAKEYYQRALAIRQKHNSNSLAVATSLNNIGAVEQKRGDLAAAKAYYQEALVIKVAHVPDSLTVAESLYNIGTVTAQQGDLIAARSYHQQALAIQEKRAPDSLAIAENLHSLGLLAEKQGDWNGAARLAHRAWQLVRRQALSVIGDEARQAFGVATAHHAPLLLHAQLSLRQKEQAFLTLEESRAQALLQLLLERQILAGATSGELWRDYQMVVTARDRAEQALSRAGVAEAQVQRKLKDQQKKSAGPARIAHTQADLEATTRKFQEAQDQYTHKRTQADKLWAAILQSAPRAFPAPLTLEQAADVLPAGTLYLAFAVGEEASYLFLLHTGDDGRPVLETYPLPKARALAAHVQTFREQMMRRIDLHGMIQAGQALYWTLFPAAARWIVDRATRLLISPDGPLWDVPFAALVTSAPGRKVRYLGGEKPITYTPSLTVFAQARRQAPALPKGQPPVALVVGDPVFERGPTTLAAAQPVRDRPRGERSYLWQGSSPPGRLPATRREAEQVARLYATAPLLDEQATEAAVRERMQWADVIHLATHGWLSRTRAMDSGLLLTPPEKEPDPGEYANDGFLQAWEIHSQLKLRAELVVLSGCETARGQVVRGEGLVGLVRALQYAGARSVAASQWKVLDEQTAKLMVQFHQELRQGVAKDEALRRAMAHVRERLGLRHPYHWAGFLLLGDPDNPNLGARP